MINFTFSKQQISELHNIRVYLHSSVGSLTNILHPDCIERITKQLAKLDLLMAPVYEQEAKEDSIRQEEIEKVQRELEQITGGPLKSVWSLGNFESFDTIPFFHDVNELRLARGRYLDGDSDFIDSVELHGNPTYKDLWLAAEYLISGGPETDHIFIESFTIGPKGSAILLLHTGS